MPLAQTVDSLDSVPEAARGAYVQKDGKFVLDFEVPDVTGLKNTVQATRKERDDLIQSVKEWQKLGKAPAEIEQMLAAERAEKEAALLKAGRVDEVLATRLGQAKQEFDGALGVEKTKAERAASIARGAVVESKLGAALVKGKASAEGMHALPKLIGDRVKVEFDDAGEAKISIFAPDGKTPMVGSGEGGLATFDDLVKEAIKTFPSLFEGTGSGSGNDPQGHRRNAGGKTLTRKEFDAMSPQDKATKMKDGFKVVD